MLLSLKLNVVQDFKILWTCLRKRINKKVCLQIQHHAKQKTIPVAQFSRKNSAEIEKKKSSWKTKKIINNIAKEP